ncbi:MAG: hypothetical protein R2684_13310 [Pyrinomonadaceae bacterium]
MYRRPKFLEQLLEIREEMSREAFYDADLFAEQVRSGKVVISKKVETKTKVNSKTVRDGKKKVGS